MTGERISVWAEAAAWAELRNRRRLVTVNMAGEEGNKVRSCRCLSFILNPWAFWAVTWFDLLSSMRGRVEAGREEEAIINTSSR